MSSNELALLIGGAAVAGFVQGISGFAFGMVAMSFWVWGIEPRVAAVLTVAGGLSGQVLSAFTVRRGLTMATLLPFLLGGLVGIPIGVALLPHLDPVRFKLMLGCMLVVFCPAMLVAKDLPRFSRGGRTADALAGTVGGVMGGLGGFTGVVPSLWCTLRGYDKDLQRSVIQNFNLAALAGTLCAYLVSGAVTPDMLPRFAVVLPALIVPSMLGARIYRGLSPLMFRRVVLAVLCLAGLVMIAGSLPATLGYR
jgi:uncharacterized membrane protein YfcA